MGGNEVKEETRYRGWESTVQEWMGVRDLKVSSVWTTNTNNKEVDEEDDEEAQEAERRASWKDQIDSKYIAPYSEGQPCCPICGEVFVKIFQNSDWWVTGVVVVDAITNQQLSYESTSGGRRLHDNALIYHKSCYDG